MVTGGGSGDAEPGNGPPEPARAQGNSGAATARPAVSPYFHRRGRALRPLRNRDFALLWSGQSVSLLGDGVFTVALALAALRLSKGPYVLSVVLAARLLPTVALLVVSGAVTDRVARRTILLASDLTRGLAVAAIAALTAVNALQVWQLVAMSVAFGAADAFFMPAATAIVPDLVGPELLTQAAALESSTWVISQNLIGPALGGVLVATLGLAASFGLDAVSFAASATCLALMSPSRPAARSGHSVLVDIRLGMRYVFSQRWLWATLVAAAVASFAAFAPAGVLLPLLVERVLHGGPADLGLVLAAGGLGGLTGTLIVGRFGAPRLRITAMWACWGVSSILFALIGLSSALWVVAALSALGWAFLMYASTLWNPLIQSLVPSDMLGRASAVDWLFSLSLSPLGVLAAGLATAAVGVRTTFVIGGVVAASMALVVFVPGVRDPEHDRVGSPPQDSVDR